MKNDLKYNLDHPLETFENVLAPFGGEGHAVAGAGELVGKGVGKAASFVGKFFSTEEVAKETTVVGRWMSAEEHALMKQTGKVQESLSGTTHVANPANAEAFMKQAAPGSRYVEFKVSVDSVKMTNQGWAKIIGPNSLEGRMALRKGLTVPEMPSATDITWIASKLRQ
jgi:hypothetical protein